MVVEWISKKNGRRKKKQDLGKRGISMRTENLEVGVLNIFLHGNLKSECET
jgi:hypothetical protein